VRNDPKSLDVSVGVDRKIRLWSNPVCIGIFIVCLVLSRVTGKSH